MFLWLMIHCIAFSKNPASNWIWWNDGVCCTNCNAITFDESVFFHCNAFVNHSILHLEKSKIIITNIFENKLLCHWNDLVSFIFLSGSFNRWKFGSVILIYYRKSNFPLKLICDWTKKKRNQHQIFTIQVVWYF